MVRFELVADLPGAFPQEKQAAEDQHEIFRGDRRPSFFEGLDDGGTIDCGGSSVFTGVTGACSSAGVTSATTGCDPGM